MVTIEHTEEPRTYGVEIRELLAAADQEFVPPLSAREGTTQTEGLSEQRNNTLDEYYEQCIDQEIIIAREGENVWGFLSYRKGYSIEELDGYTPAAYISTIIVAPERRREGIARRLYYEILESNSVEERYAATRTWSTNDSHLDLLDELGFELVKRVRDDRGDGIDTVYYGINISEFDR